MKKTAIILISFTAAYWCIMILPMLRLEFLVYIDAYRTHTLRPLLCLYPFLFGGLLYYLFGRKTEFRIKTFFKSLAISFIWLLSVFALCIGALSYYFIAIEKSHFFKLNFLFNHCVTSPFWIWGICFFV
jgi:hypothetical protein